MSESTFVHLNLHSEFSLVDGIVRIKPLVNRLSALNMPAVALTDQTNIFGAVKFYRACLGAGVKPILGADVHLRNPDEPAKPFHLILLCQHDKGYKNLLQLISKAYLEGQHLGVAMVDQQWVADHADGLIALSGGLQGDVGQAIVRGDVATAKRHLQTWQTLFPNRFYIELQRTGRPQENEYIDQVMPLAAELQLPVVATNAVRYLMAEDFDAHEARVCIHDGRLLNDSKRPRRYSQQQYLRTSEEMQALFADIPQALQNTVEIAKRCNAKLSLGEVFLPDFPVPEGMTVESYLEASSREGLKARLIQLNIPEELQAPYYDRLKIELGVINRMGFPGYFLIVADFIQWAKNNDVPVGPGRGSGAGSIVAYALKITDLDPLQYDLLFERFLNPERVSMPDFDIDFCMEGRDRVIDYVAQTYGRDSVSQIITFGTMAARAVVRDVGRVLGFPYGQVDRIAKMIPFEIGMTLEKALRENDLQESYQKEDDVRSIIDLAKSLEGISRNAGKHAGGVVIAPGSLSKFTAVYCEEGSQNAVSQFDKDDVETIGLVKFDFLGLRTLTIIHWAVQTINTRLAKEKKPLVDIAKIPLDDEKTFQLLQRCETTAVFQLESRGMKELVGKLQPNCFEDIVPLVALFRPGPLQSGMVDDFVDRRHGRARIEYPHPKLEAVLKPTYGVILYQEQVMQIAQELAGYSLGGADLLRRAMGKKKIEEMARERQKFVEGSVERGVLKAQAEKIFDLMEKFAGYGFNKSHSAAYGLIAYQTAWLKAHYPAEFMSAVLSSDMDHTDKVVRFFSDTVEQGIKVLPPNINYSAYKFTVNDAGEILYGLGAIKGAGGAAIDIVLDNRQENGAFKDLFDFCCRIDMRKANKRVMEALIKSGALDDLGQHRAELLANLPAVMQAAEQTLRQQAQQQDDLFGEMDITKHEHPHLEPIKAWPDKIRLQAEKETLGLYLSGHPMTPYRKELAQFTAGTLARLKPSGKNSVIVAGLVAGIRTMMTKRGDRMAFVTLDDDTARVELAVFSDVYHDAKDMLQSDEIVVVEGDVSVDDYSGNYRMSCKRVMSMSQAREQFARRLRLNLAADQKNQSFSKALAEVLKDYRGGSCPIRIHYQQEKAEAVLPLDRSWAVRPEDELIEQLRALLNQDAVEVEY
jgi:DNA polymerase III subunit alpha